MVVRVMLSMPPEFLAQVDAVAGREHRSRSDLVREALRRYLESRYGAEPTAAARGSRPVDTPDGM
jgi:metal-responsive CopG/Arc/MetJ family transcriptional regulator